MVRVKMATLQEHSCVGCGVSMPLEDGHDKCVLCLGYQHAILSRENPQSCMDCFILPARTREARCRFFGVKRAGSPLSGMPKGKVGRMAEATHGQGECSRRPTTGGQPRADPLPTSTPVLQEEEGIDSEDVDVETVFSSEGDDHSLSCGQMAGNTSLACRFDEVIGRASRALDVTPPYRPYDSYLSV